jgi:Ca-activated chloride channel family protein
MTFSSSILLVLFVLGAAAAALASVLYFKRYRDEIGKFVSAKTAPVVLDSDALRKRARVEIISAAAVCLLLAALAGPQYGTRLVNIKRKSVDVIIAVDCSRSMLARDVDPDRMSKAKEMLSVLIDRLKENRIGVIAFAGTAFVQCPLTYDYNSAKMLLGLINTDLIPMPGTSLGSAIGLAAKSLVPEKSASKVLVLLTDGEDHKSDPLGAAKDAAGQGIRIYTVGIGTARGEPIPEGASGGTVSEYKRDKKGQVVTSRLDERLLSGIADAAGGRYYPMAYGDVGVAEQIYSDISMMEKTETKAGVYAAREHRFQIPLFAAVILLFAELLYGADLSFVARFLSNLRPLILITSFITVCAAGSASAGVRGDIKKGNRLYGQGRYDEALQRYSDALIKKPDQPEAHFNSGDVFYRQGDYAGALKEYGGALGKTKNKKTLSKIFYNMGNASFMGDDKNEALKNYKQALNLNSRDEDAKHNIALILSGKAKQQQQQKQKSGAGKKEEKGKDQQKQKQGGKPEEKKKYMSKEDAERLLQMAGEQEKEAMKRKAKPAAPRLPAVEEDW